jgi:hypothetical protein
VIVASDVSAGQILLNIALVLVRHAFPATAPAGDAPGPLEMLDYWDFVLLWRLVPDSSAPQEARPTDG